MASPAEPGYEGGAFLPMVTGLRHPISAIAGGSLRSRALIVS